MLKEYTGNEYIHYNPYTYLNISVFVDAFLRNNTQPLSWDYFEQAVKNLKQLFVI